MRLRQVRYGNIPHLDIKGYQRKHRRILAEKLHAYGLGLMRLITRISLVIVHINKFVFISAALVKVNVNSNWYISRCISCFLNDDYWDNIFKNNTVFIELQLTIFLRKDSCESLIDFVRIIGYGVWSCSVNLRTLNMIKNYHIFNLKHEIILS